MPLVSGEELLELFPHRARNVLIDKADVPLEPGGQNGTGWLEISPGDAAGRDVILYEADGVRFILSAFAAECIALGSICVLAPDLNPGDVCFFSTISSVEFSARVPAEEPLRVEVNRQKDRGPFKRFQGSVLRDGSSEKVASADIMAYTLTARQAGAISPEASRWSPRLLMPQMQCRQRKISASNSPRWCSPMMWSAPPVTL